MSEEETRGLLHGKAIQTSAPSISWRHHMCGPILFFHLFAFIMSYATSGLYIPQYLSRKLYPTRTMPVSAGSICIINETDISPESENIQKEAALFGIYTALVSGIPAVISNLLLGTFSDRFGRIFMFLAPTIGQMISKTIILFCVYYQFDINYILIGSAIEGVLGGYLAILMASFSYIADITENNKQRSVAITFLEIAVGVGAVVGRFSTGYFIKATNYVWPIFTSCCIYALLIFIIISVLPETRIPETGYRSTQKSCLNYVTTIFSFYISESNKGERWKYNICILIFFTTGITVVGKSGVDLLYQISQPFCWDSVKVGLYGALSSLFQNVICMGMIKILHLCLSDEGVSILGSLSGIAGFLITALATTDVMLYIAAIVGGGGVLTLPMIRAIMSRMTSPDKQGALFGGISAVETTCGIIGSLFFNSIYSHTVSFFRGTVYLVTASCVLVSLLLLLIFTICSRQTQTYKKVAEFDVKQQNDVFTKRH
ncbi:lysosomal proton-coupled steroid conjugate and bile acid symporter SLC46A3-like [Saccostrea echinata]|uniref:lysosomal proton-coupled steroid conjugate and bile acid symporter SLC46A3-like n=1 Tax=Saccostrea echinata TaxID=191078 RepID=UPI002A81E27C|nr:lysosomal proton-coupled steroid conjugate and bile acid symporter SLC46A3-like [Saccostrea echinata]